MACDMSRSSSDSSVHEFSGGDLFGGSPRPEQKPSRTAARGGKPSDFYPPVGLVPSASTGRLAQAQARFSAGLRIEVDQNFHGFQGSLVGAEGAGGWASGGAGTNSSCGTSSTPGMLVFCVRPQKGKRKKHANRTTDRTVNQRIGQRI